MILNFLRNMRLISVMNQGREEFSGLSRIERAYTIIMAGQWLLTSEKGSQLYSKILRSPDVYSSDQCYQVYGDMEQFKAYQENALRKMEGKLKSIGMNGDSNEPNHSRMMYTGLLFWLVRLAGFVNIKKQRDAELIIKSIAQNVCHDDIDAALASYGNFVSFAKSMGDSKAVYDENLLRKTAMEVLKII